MPRIKDARKLSPFMAAESPLAHPDRRGLPLQLTSFVGRAREVEEVRALLGRRGC